MIFRVYEPYDDNQLNYNNYVKPEECFICYEIKTELDIYPISLKSQEKYNKSCGCDGWIHNQCLDIWYKKQKKCPVCRLEIYEKPNDVGVVINVVPYSNRIYIFACKSLHRMAIIVLYCFLACSIVEFFLNILVTKQLRNNNYETRNYVPYPLLESNDSEFFDDIMTN